MNSEQVHQYMADLGQPSQCIETHISWVVLTEEFAYKIKKPVTFSFLDYGSLPLRLRGCQEEVRLNSRLASKVYLCVVALRSQGGQIVNSTNLADGPDLIDYAVKMRRLDTSFEMDRMLAAGKLGVKDFEVLAIKVAAFHLQADPVHNPGQSDPDNYRRDFNDILHEAATLVNVLGEEAMARISVIVNRSDAFLQDARHRKLIQDRGRRGFVRDLHGDLHSRNIFAYAEPVIFDCVEFNDHFRHIDVLNEVAFLCMDLEEQGHEEFSNAFLRTYLEAFPEAMPAEAAPLLEWFKLYRANVRAKVNALQWADSEDQAATAREIEGYFSLMERYSARLEGAGGA